MRVLQVDEWGGLEKNHPASCEADVRVKLLEPLKIKSDRYFGFRTQASNAESECARMREWLAKNGPIDICILGLGLNGHVAMNEPAAELAPHAHVAALARSSLHHPMLKDLKAKPRYGLTLGMRDILSSQLVLLLVNGTHKRSALKRLLQPTVTTSFPASFIWLHPRGYVLCDREAAGKLPGRPA
jgi:galactosamine-6-phosphate isomerase